MTEPDSVPSPADAQPRGPKHRGQEKARSRAEAAALAAAFFLLALVAIYLSRQPGAIATVWFANAVGVAFLALRPIGHWPALLTAVALGNLAANLAYGDPLTLSVSFVPANTLEVLAGGLLMRRFGRVDRWCEDAPTLLRSMAAGALLPQIVGATLGAAVLHWHGFARFEAVWVDWYAGSALGAIASLPVALTILNANAASTRAQLASINTAAVILLSLGVTLLALSQLPYPFVYATLPMIFAALWLPPLVAFAMAFLNVLCVTAALAFGVFSAPAATSTWQHLLVYTAAVAAVLPAQLLAAVVERQRAQDRMLSALSSVTSDLTSFVDNNAVYRLTNRAHETYFALPREAIVGKHISQLVPPERYATLVQPRLALALAGQTLQFRAEIDYAGRGRRTMDISYLPAFDGHERQIGVVLKAHDVTDLVATQTTLEQSLAGLRASNESLEQFVHISSHDLREPLNTIMQFCGLIRDDHGAELSGPAKAYFDHVFAGAARMRTMLDDVLSFARLDPSQTLAMSAVPLDEVMSQVNAALAARVSQRGARIDIASLPTVLGHPSLLALLFQNLVSNAIKFVPADRLPQVAIAARAEGGKVVVSVSDNGIGIEAAQVPLLFAPFKRLHSRRKFDGTGLGLAIAKRIVLAHGGAIVIESEPGLGSRFHVTLRRAA